MKSILKFFIACLIMTSIGCSDSDTTVNISEEIKGEWKLMLLTGGLAGVNCDYTQDEVLWTFDDGQLNYDVTLTTDSTDICNGFVNTTEVKNYSIVEVDDQSFLEINGSDNGLVTISNDTLFHNQNILQSGAGADGFVYRLVKN